MPNVLIFGPYVLFFWMVENGESVHVHIAIRCPAENATKPWMTAEGGCLLANNDSKIPRRDLRDIAQLITLNHAYSCDKWIETFGNSLSFYR